MKIMTSCNMTICNTLYRKMYKKIYGIQKNEIMAVIFLIFSRMIIPIMARGILRTFLYDIALFKISIR